MTNDERIATARKAVLAALRTRGYVSHDPLLTVVGSTYIRDALSPSDVDILCCIPNSSIDELDFDGWEYGGSSAPCPNNDKWMSWKKVIHGVVINMLVTNSREYERAWATAAEVCRYLHLKGYDILRCDVHGIHEIIMDGSTAEDELPKRNY